MYLKFLEFLSAVAGSFEALLMRTHTNVTHFHGKIRKYQYFIHKKDTFKYLELCWTIDSKGIDSWEQRTQSQLITAEMGFFLDQTGLFHPRISAQWSQRTRKYKLHYSEVREEVVQVLLASVAQSDECRTGDQEFAGSTPVGLATFFLRPFSPFCLFKKGSCNSGKRMHNTG